MIGEYVVYLGGPCIDEYYSYDAWPREGDKFVAHFKGPVAGGMIANAACVMASLGMKTYCFYGMSKGPDTDFLMNDLERHQVDTSKIILRENARDPKCFIFQGKKDRTIAVIPGDPWKIRLNQEQETFLKNASFVYTALSNLLDYEDPLRLCRMLKEAGVKIVFDNEASTMIDNWEAYMEYCYFASMNDHALQVYGNGLTVTELEQKILGLGVKVFVETLGKDGCKVVTAEEQFTVGTYAVDVIDTTGAGDTFNTCFTYGLCKGYSLRKTAEFATAAANMAITKQGPRGGIATVEEIESFMKEHQLV